MMEEMNKSSHGKKNKLQRLGLTVGAGDGIGGIVLLGGGLAVAGLIAAFSIIKNKSGKKYDDDSPTPSNKKNDATHTHGLSFFLQTPSTTLHQNHNSCFTSHETSKIAHTGDQAVPILDGEKEKPSNFQPGNFSNISAEVSSLPAPDGPSLAKPENMIKNESGGDLHLKEAIEVKKEDDEVETENLAVEKNLPIQLAEEEEEDEEEDGDGGSSDEDVTEEEVESLEEESSLEDHSPIQSVEEEEEEKVDGAGDRGKECLVVKEGESSEGEWSVEDEVKKEDELGELGNLAVEENSPTQSVEEEEGDDSSEEHNIEREEGKLSVEENAAMESAEKEKEDGQDDNTDEDSGEEQVMEKGEESSDCSPIESNVQAIWPAEMIEALSQELKEMNGINQTSGENKANETDKYHFLDCKRKRNIKNEDESNNETTENATTVFHQKAAPAVVMMNGLTVNDLNRRIWVWSILVLLLLMLLLHIHRTAVPADLIYHDPVLVP